MLQTFSSQPRNVGRGLIPVSEMSYKSLPETIQNGYSELFDLACLLKTGVQKQVSSCFYYLKFFTTGFISELFICAKNTALGVYANMYPCNILR